VVADGSICNRLEPEDYRRLHDEARAAVEREALKQGLLRQAEEHARELVRAVTRPFGYEVEIHIIGPTLTASGSENLLR
jgi:hypothetical protein